jgi:aminomethyltransferase
MGKGEFQGRAALEAEAVAGVPKHLHGLVVDGRRPPRERQAVILDGSEIGAISSGNFSPVREQGIALAFLDRPLEPGTRVTIDVRGKDLAAVVHRPPFV